MNRKAFISMIGAAGATAAIAPRLFASESKPRLKVGLVGCGWYGKRTMDAFARAGGCEVVSLCDVNKVNLNGALQSVAKFQDRVPLAFEDYREMLRSTQHDIVIVATPNHWHALPAIAAMEAGADVHVEKPVGHDVIEGEAMVAAARKYKRVVQVNTQRRSTAHFIEAKEKYIRSGRLGPIGLVETFGYLKGRLTEVVPNAEPPTHLNYDMWVGPAPMTPFKTVKENRGWRDFSDYSNGLTGDVGVHMFDATRWLLGLGWPTSIRSTGGIYIDKNSSADITDTQRSVFTYPDLDVSWEHRTWGGSEIPQGHWSDQWGTRIIGKNGTLKLTLLGYVYTPAEGGPREGIHLFSKTGNLENIEIDEKVDYIAETETQHCRDFLRARETRSRPVADIEEGHISTACCVLANLSQKLGRTLVYDPTSRTVKGDAEATSLLKKNYRSPWVHPDPTNV